MIRGSNLLLLLLLLLALLAASAASGVDTDGDGIEDPSDSCPQHVNPHAEDSDGDGIGDVCDPDTINAVLEATAGPMPAFHARTPWYRLRVSPSGGLEISPEAGLGTEPTPGIGVGIPPDPVLVQPVDLTGVTGGYAPGPFTPGPSSWQTLTIPDVFVTGAGGPPPLRGFVASHANGASLGYEIPLASVPAATAATVDHDVVLPAGWTLDAAEVADGGGIGRLSVRDPGGTAVLRISAVEVIAYGSDTTIADSAGFHGLQRLAEELQGEAQIATVGPPDLVGSDFQDGKHAPLVQTSYSLETQKDGALGTTSVVPLGGSSYRVGMTAPAAVLDRNRASSSHVFLGWRVSALTPVDLGSGSPGAPAPTVHGRHLVFFDDEAVVTGSENVIELHNNVGTFDGEAPDYALFPDGGGTAADYDVLSQQQTAFGCAGCTMDLTGDTQIDFSGGGVGVGIAPGPRVGPGDPCLASDPLNETTASGRCAVDRGKRARFDAERVTISGSMSGLVAGESDVSLDELAFDQMHDPNVTDPTLLYGVMGIGCAAEAGVRIGVNPSNGDVLGNVPLDPNACAPDDVGAGVCLPPALASPPGTGVCNLSLDRVVLRGMGSVENPLGTDPTLPAGVGIALHTRTGSGRIGDLSYDAGTDTCSGSLVSGASEVKGFDALASFSGGANVDAATGEPKARTDAGAVPPTVFCVTNVLGDELGVGLVMGANVDVRARHLEIRETQLGAVQVSNGGANVADVASTTEGGTPCPSVDEQACRTPAQELACPGCVQGGEHFAAATSAGLTAPTRLSVRDSVLGLDPVSGVVSGSNPALPALVLNDDLVATGGGLTMARRLAGLLRPPVQMAWGPDTLIDPALLSIELTDNNIGVNTVALSLDNFDSPGGTRDVTLTNNCYSADGASCITSGSGVPVVGAAAFDAGVAALHSDAMDDAAEEPNENAGVKNLPEPAARLALPASLLLLGLLARLRRRRAAHRPD